MPIPSSCPKCQAPFPESIERFGANSICKACGQILRFDEPFPEFVPEPIPVPAGSEDEDDQEVSTDLPPIDVLMSDGWQIFRERMGLCIGTFVLSFILNFIAQTPGRIWQEQLMQGRVAPEHLVLTAVGFAVATLCQTAFSTWLHIGYTRMMLRVVRDQPIEIGDLFRGGKYFVRGLLCTLVVSMAIFAGTLLCIVPGFVIALMYWPFLYIMIDHDSPGIEAIWKASEITYGNKWNLFGLFAICFLLWMFGLLALGIGLLFAAPYTFVVIALAYDRISGVRRPWNQHQEDEADSED